MSASVLTFPKDPDWLREPPRPPRLCSQGVSERVPPDPASQRSAGSALLKGRRPIHHGPQQMAHHFQSGSRVSTDGQGSHDSGGRRAS